MRISDWSSDVCSSDLTCAARSLASPQTGKAPPAATVAPSAATPFPNCRRSTIPLHPICPQIYTKLVCRQASFIRSEEHTSELQSLMRTSYAVFCLKKKTVQLNTTKRQQ